MKVGHENGACFLASGCDPHIVVDQPEEYAGSDAGMAPQELMASSMHPGCKAGPSFHCGMLSMRGFFDDPRRQSPENEPIFVPHRNGRFELGYCLRQRME